MNTQNTNTMNQEIVELSKRYDYVQKERAAVDMRGENSYHLYKEMMEIEKEIKALQEKRDSLNQNTENELQPYYVEQVTDNGVTYFQLVRRRDDAILYSNVSLWRVADRLNKPTYKDGTPINIDMTYRLELIRGAETPSKKLEMIRELSVKISNFTTEEIERAIFNIL